MMLPRTLALTAAACLVTVAATGGCASDSQRGARSNYAAKGPTQPTCAIVLVKAGEAFVPNTNDYIDVKRSLEPLFAMRNISIEPDIRRALMVATVEWRERPDSPEDPDLVILAVENNPHYVSREEERAAAFEAQRYIDAQRRNRRPLNDRPERDRPLPQILISDEQSAAEGYRPPLL